MKALALTLLTTAALVGTTQADEFETYQNCWSQAATAHLNTNGLSEATLADAVRTADVTCVTERQAAEATWDDEQPFEQVRDIMETSLYRANPLPEDQPASP